MESNSSHRVRFLAGFASAVLVTAGCAADIANFDLVLPEKEIKIDSEQWQLQGDGNVPSQACGDNPGICMPGVKTFCQSAEAGVCFAQCEPGPQTCKVIIAINLWNTIEMDKEAPELQNIDGAPIGKISVKRIFYKITENTFNVESPPLTVAVAPQGVMAVGDAQAKEVGIIAAIPAGQTVESMDVEFTEEGLSHMQSFLKNYTTPFNLIVGGRIDLSADDQIPTGRLTAVVQVEATAGL